MRPMGEILRPEEHITTLEWLKNGVLDPNLTVALYLNQNPLGLTPEELIRITSPHENNGIELDPTQIKDYQRKLPQLIQKINNWISQNSDSIPPFAIIFPTYMEEENIGPTLENFANALPKGIMPTAILIIDSSSPDSTIQKGIIASQSALPPNMQKKTTIITDQHLASILGIDPTTIVPGKGTNFWLGIISAIKYNPKLLSDNGWIWIVDTDARYPPVLYTNMLLAMIKFSNQPKIMIRANLLRLTKAGDPTSPWQLGGRVTRTVREWINNNLLDQIANPQVKQILQNFAQLHQPFTGFYGIRANLLQKARIPSNYALETWLNLWVLKKRRRIEHPFMGIHAQTGNPQNSLFSPAGMFEQIKNVLELFASTGALPEDIENVTVYHPLAIF